jgi:hypothetical protein
MHLLDSLVCMNLVVETVMIYSDIVIASRVKTRGTLPSGIALGSFIPTIAAMTASISFDSNV